MPEDFSNALDAETGAGGVAVRATAASSALESRGLGWTWRGEGNTPSRMEAITLHQARYNSQHVAVIAGADVPGVLCHDGGGGVAARSRCVGQNPLQNDITNRQSVL